MIPKSKSLTRKRRGFGMTIGKRFVNLAGKTRVLEFFA